MRKVFAKADMTLLGRGGWLSLYGLSPEQTGLKFTSEIAARNNGKYGGAKCLRLVTSQPLEARQETGMPYFCKTLREIGLQNITVQLLATVRPFTFFEGAALDHLTVNYQLELPGGIIEQDEDARFASLREAMEEGGKAHTIQVASLMPYGCPYDAGSHTEVYSLETALVHATKLDPPARDGVIPDKSVLIPLLEAEGWLRDQATNGIPIEGYVGNSLALLGLALHGGWESVR